MRIPHGRRNINLLPYLLLKTQNLLGSVLNLLNSQKYSELGTLQDVLMDHFDIFQMFARLSSFPNDAGCYIEHKYLSRDILSPFLG